jgi:hypothetical protein
MSENTCIKEEDLGKMGAQIDICLNHVEESNKAGGYRDRVLVLEQTQAQFKDTLLTLDRHIKNASTRSAIIGGIIGGLIGAASPTTIQALISIILKVVK